MPSHDLQNKAGFPKLQCKIFNMTSALSLVSSSHYSFPLHPSNSPTKLLLVPRTCAGSWKSESLNVSLLSLEPYLTPFSNICPEKIAITLQLIIVTEFLPPAATRAKILLVPAICASESLLDRAREAGSVSLLSLYFQLLSQHQVGTQ